MPCGDTASPTSPITPLPTGRTDVLTGGGTSTRSNRDLTSTADGKGGEGSNHHGNLAEIVIAQTDVSTT